MGRADPLELFSADDPTESAANWADPDIRLLNRADLPAPNPPLECFGAFWARWLEGFASAKTTPVDFAVAGFILVVSASLGATRAARLKSGWKELPVFWSLVVGTPSAGKSPSLDPFASVLRDIEALRSEGFSDVRRRYETEKLLAEIAEKRWQEETATRVKGRPALQKPPEADPPAKPVPPRLVVADTTIEALAPLFAGNPRGLVLYRDEIAGWFGNIDKYGGGGNVPFFLERWASQPVTVDRRNAEPIKAKRGMLGILGGIQPAVLASFLRRPDDGFLARFLLFAPRSKPMSFNRQAVDLAPLSEAATRLAKLDFGDSEEPIELPLNGHAEDFFARWYDELQRRAHREPSTFLEGFLGKAGSTVARLALVIEYAEWSISDVAEPTSISETAVKAATRLFDEYLEPMYRRAIGLASRTPEEVAASALLKHTEANKLSVLNQRSLTRNSPIEKDLVEGALETLTTAGWLRRRKAKGAGRPRKDFDVNPLLFA